MHFKTLFICLFSLSALVFSTSAFAVILYAQGDKPNSPAGMALGIDLSTPRTGSAIDPFRRDTTIFNQRSTSLWKGCGSTIQSGALNVATLTTRLVQKSQIAQASPGGSLYMVLHQITGSGAGPYSCSADPTGTGADYTKKIDVTRQVPGQSPIINQVTTTQFAFQIAIPTDLKCSGSYGGMNNICIIRCQNAATSGPYGACIPVQVV